ncbi:Lar family restriction alleviation protein [Deinococcus sp. HMF7604]|uniref:Lar family restriction alleviation protein n=1 Tax=Deinococcus betulae TaxID=2873312 RepID=UPI001CCADCA2|nr:Lar family restriction alleviation protein [Deinococcus betulae]MBZ9750703.1 Lar family restriction alleviation protein [Deinococcus betulae]
MDFPTPCPACGHANRVAFTESGVHDVTCAQCGARSCVFLRKQRFEVLFDLGTRALMDGYAREAVASFAAALERFFEFYVRAFALEQAANTDRDFSLVQGALDGTWRHVASQSERQLGMFALSYLLRQGREPDFLTPAGLGTDFRNRVIHRGALPTRAEVDAYAAAVFALMDRLLSELGPAAAHVELAQEQVFAAHLARLPANVTAVFEEHPGMFRARRFGGLAPAVKPARPEVAGGRSVNDAKAFQQALFQQALAERGALLRAFKGSRG